MIDKKYFVNKNTILQVFLPIIVRKINYAQASPNEFTVNKLENNN